MPSPLYKGEARYHHDIDISRKIEILLLLYYRSINLNGLLRSVTNRDQAARGPSSPLAGYFYDHNIRRIHPSRVLVYPRPSSRGSKTTTSVVLNLLPLQFHVYLLFQVGDLACVGIRERPLSLQCRCCRVRRAAALVGHNANQRAHQTNHEDLRKKKCRAQSTHTTPPMAESRNATRRERRCTTRQHSPTNVVCKYYPRILKKLNSIRN